LSDALPELPEQIYLRLSVTDRCNLRCQYCRPAEGDADVGPPAARREELLALVQQINAVVGIAKLRVTGGEPLLVEDPEGLVGNLHALLPAARLGMTTNGVLLARHASGLYRAGLRYLNISLDTLESEPWEQLTRGGRLDLVLAGIRAACQAGFTDVKFNTVLLRSINGDQLCELVRHAARWGCELRFIELMPMGEGGELYDEQYFSADEAHQQLTAAFAYVGPAPGAGTARRHRFRIGDREITIGYITSVSHPFCEGCDRYRLDSRGVLFSCLRDEQGHDLLSPLRAGQLDAVRHHIRSGLAGKTAAKDQWPDRSMAKIGG
jgi:cyclic pyranopterin phosphate synthase